MCRTQISQKQPRTLFPVLIGALVLIAAGCLNSASVSEPRKDEQDKDEQDVERSKRHATWTDVNSREEYSEAVSQLLRDLDWSDRTLLHTEFPSELFFCAVHRDSIGSSVENDDSWYVSDSAWDDRVFKALDTTTAEFHILPMPAKDAYFQESVKSWKNQGESLESVQLAPFLAPLGRWKRLQGKDADGPKRPPPELRAIWVYWPSELGVYPLGLSWVGSSHSNLRVTTWDHNQELLQWKERLSISFAFAARRDNYDVASQLLSKDLSRLRSLSWWRVGDYLGVAPEVGCATILLLYPGLQIGVGHMVLTTSRITTTTLEFDVTTSMYDANMEGRCGEENK